MKLTLWSSLLFIVLISCHAPKKINKEAEIDKILSLHNLQRDYHFNKDSISFANQLYENFISVNRGVISQPDRQATISRYHNYFSAVEFMQWDDVSEPIVRLSDDGTLAYTIVDKMVEVSYEGTNGDQIVDSTHFAWTTIYRKYGDAWKIDCVTSTEKPVQDN